MLFKLFDLYLIVAKGQIYFTIFVKNRCHKTLIICIIPYIEIISDRSIKMNIKDSLMLICLIKLIMNI